MSWPSSRGQGAGQARRRSAFLRVSHRRRAPACNHQQPARQLVENLCVARGDGARELGSRRKSQEKHPNGLGGGRPGAPRSPQLGHNFSCAVAATPDVEHAMHCTHAGLWYARAPRAAMFAAMRRQLAQRGETPADEHQQGVTPAAESTPRSTNAAEHQRRRAPTPRSTNTAQQARAKQRGGTSCVA